jgi:hypothetical protein
MRKRSGYHMESACVIIEVKQEKDGNEENEE